MDDRRFPLVPVAATRIALDFTLGATLLTASSWMRPQSTFDKNLSFDYSLAVTAWIRAILMKIIAFLTLLGLLGTVFCFALQFMFGIFPRPNPYYHYNIIPVPWRHAGPARHLSERMSKEIRSVEPARRIEHLNNIGFSCRDFDDGARCYYSQTVFPTLDRKTIVKIEPSGNVSVDIGYSSF